MNAEDNEVPLLQPAGDTSARTSISSDAHNLTIRRRNVIESVNTTANNNMIDSYDRVPLITLRESTKAWSDGIIPRIPDFTDMTSSVRQNGTLIRQDDHDSNTNDLRIMDPIKNRIKMKISVIRGSIVNPDFTLGELRLLGCSSEGFVNGTLQR